MYTGQGLNPPQLNGLSANTKLVTVSIGGNDITALGPRLLSLYLAGDPGQVPVTPRGTQDGVHERVTGRTLCR